MLKTFSFDLRHDLIVDRFLRPNRDGQGNHEWCSQQCVGKQVPEPVRCHIGNLTMGLLRIAPLRQVTNTENSQPPQRGIFSLYFARNCSNVCNPG